MSTKFKVGDTVKRVVDGGLGDRMPVGSVWTIKAVKITNHGTYLDVNDGQGPGWDIDNYELVSESAERKVGDSLFRGESWTLTDPKTGGRKGMRIVRYDKLPPEALAEIAACFGTNLKKYEDDPSGKANYELGMPYSWHLRAAYTHLEKFRSGVDFDEDDNIHHLAHAATLLMFLLTYQARDIGTDDRPLHA